jgi:hypothetical protein
VYFALEGPCVLQRRQKVKETKTSELKQCTRAHQSGQNDALQQEVLPKITAKLLGLALAYVYEILTYLAYYYYHHTSTHGKDIRQPLLKASGLNRNIIQVSLAQGLGKAMMQTTCKLHGRFIGGHIDPGPEACPTNPGKHAHTSTIRGKNAPAQTYGKLSQSARYEGRRRNPTEPRRPELSTENGPLVALALHT